MPDDVTPEQAGTVLDAARQVGGLRYVQAADELTRAGIPIPWNHQRMLTEVRAAASPTASVGGHISEKELVAIGDRLVASGHDPARVEQLIRDAGVPEYQRDSRSPEQLQHDRHFGLENRYSDPLDYNYTLPDAYQGDQGLPEVENSLRDIAADIGLERAEGSQLIPRILSASAEIVAANARGERSALLERWEGQLRQAYERAGADYDAAVKNIVDLLAFSNNPFVGRLKASGVLKNPIIFQSLAGRGARVALWKQSRPA